MNRKEAGAVYEKAAAEYLIQKGHSILCRNYRIRSGEIDLITKEKNYLVFVEVKYRSSSVKGTGLDAVDGRKQKKIIRTARHYLLVSGYREDTPCRFDVISFDGDKLTHIENAFEV